MQRMPYGLYSMFLYFFLAFPCYNVLSHQLRFNVCGVRWFPRLVPSPNCTLLGTVLFNMKDGNWAIYPWPQSHYSLWPLCHHFVTTTQRPCDQSKKKKNGGKQWLASSRGPVPSSENCCCFLRLFFIARKIWYSICNLVATKMVALISLTGHRPLFASSFSMVAKWSKAIASVLRLRLTSCWQSAIDAKLAYHCCQTFICACWWQCRGDLVYTCTVYI